MKASGGTIALRWFFASFPLWSLGVLAWVPSLRIAVIRRRPKDWWVFTGFVALTVAYILMLWLFPEDNENLNLLGGFYILFFLPGSAVHGVLADRFPRVPTQTPPPGAAGGWHPGPYGPAAPGANPYGAAHGGHPVAAGWHPPAHQGQQPPAQQAPAHYGQQTPAHYGPQASPAPWQAPQAAPVPQAASFPQATPARQTAPMPAPDPSHGDPSHRDAAPWPATPPAAEAGGPGAADESPPASPRMRRAASELDELGDLLREQDRDR